MAYYPQNAVGLNYIQYPATTPVTTGLQLVAPGSSNTKGSYAEFVASSAFECNYVHVTVRATVATAGRLYLFDIATGAGGSESVKVPNLTAEGTSTNSSVYGHGLYPIPWQIAASTRIAGRCQCSTASEVMTVTLKLIAAGDVDGIDTFVNYGANTADSGATQIDPGATADTKGAYSQLTASTSAIIQYLLLIATYGHATVGTAGWFADLATGAGGAEVVLIPDNAFYSATNAGGNPALHPRSYPYLTYIAASTRLAVRASCSVNTATVRLFDANIIAGTAPAESSGGGGSYASFG